MKADCNVCIMFKMQFFTAFFSTLNFVMVATATNAHVTLQEYNQEPFLPEVNNLKLILVSTKMESIFF